MRRRLIASVAVAAAVLLPLSGCVSWFLPPTASSTSTPTGEQVDAALEPFYSQVLTWSDCDGGMQCTTAEAPLDWADPGGESIELALVRQPATSSNRIGSLLVNPGGPGGSGYDFIKDSVDYATDERLQASFDIVGFDPRGVNRSTPVTCYDHPKELDSYIFDIYPGEPGSDEWLAAADAASAAFGERCLELTGPLLGTVDTTSAARDLDMLRAILGDTKLNYLGYSYGTFLGATYADLFPQNTGHIVLDGALDPQTTSTDVSRTQAEGFESALRAYLTQCLAGSECAFSGSVDDAMVDIRALLDRLDASPLRAADGRELGSATMTNAIVLPLYSETTWPYLDQLFSSVKSGDASVAFSLADNYYGRDTDGTYANNANEAFTAINCLDYTGDSSLEAIRAEEAELVAAAPVLGSQLAYGGVGCAAWPFAATRDRVAIHAPGSADILVVGTTNDPATPYRWAEALADELDNGHLVTYNGEGHTAYNRSNDCVNDAVDDYLINGTVPASDPQC